MIHKGHAYRKVLETYEKEMQSLLRTLPVYLEEDLELFRVKVHGLKGASRQLDRPEIGDLAEQMEIAAKNQDQEFLRSNILFFLHQLESVMKEITAEKTAIPLEQGHTAPETYSAQKLFLELKKGFDSYNVRQIENAFSCVEESILDEEQKKLLQLLQEAYEELEYEKGSQLLKRME